MFGVSVNSDEYVSAVRDEGLPDHVVGGGRGEEEGEAGHLARVAEALPAGMRARLAAR